MIRPAYPLRDRLEALRRVNSSRFFVPGSGHTEAGLYDWLEWPNNRGEETPDGTVNFAFSLLRLYPLDQILDAIRDQHNLTYSSASGAIYEPYWAVVERFASGGDPGTIGPEGLRNLRELRQEAETQFRDCGKELQGSILQIRAVLAVWVHERGKEVAAVRPGESTVADIEWRDLIAIVSKLWDEMFFTFGVRVQSLLEEAHLSEGLDSAFVECQRAGVLYHYDRYRSRLLATLHAYATVLACRHTLQAIFQNDAPVEWRRIYLECSSQSGNSTESADRATKDEPGKRKRRPKRRGLVIQRLLNICRLMATSPETVASREQLNAALAEMENTDKDNILSHVDKEIGYYGGKVSGNHERVRLAREYLKEHAPKRLADLDKDLPKLKRENIKES